MCATAAGGGRACKFLQGKSTQFPFRLIVYLDWQLASTVATLTAYSQKLSKDRQLFQIRKVRCQITPITSVEAKIRFNELILKEHLYRYMTSFPKLSFKANGRLTRTPFDRN